LFKPLLFGLQQKNCLSDSICFPSCKRVWTSCHRARWRSPHVETSFH